MLKSTKDNNYSNFQKLPDNFIFNNLKFNVNGLQAHRIPDPTNWRVIKQLIEGLFGNIFLRKILKYNLCNREGMKELFHKDRLTKL